MPVFPEATATARFVTIPFSPIVVAGLLGLARALEMLEVR
jgi:hypothetical protein